MAQRLGATACYAPQDACPDAPAWPERPRLHTAVDCVGAKTSVEFLLDRVDDVVALFGVQREDYSYCPRHNRLRLCGYQGHSRPSAEYAVQLIRDGQLDLAPLVTHILPLERYGDAIDLLERQEAVKVCFTPIHQRRLRIVGLGSGAQRPLLLADGRHAEGKAITPIDCR